MTRFNISALEEMADEQRMLTEENQAAFLFTGQPLVAVRYQVRPDRRDKRKPINTSPARSIA